MLLANHGNAVNRDDVVELVSSPEAGSLQEAFELQLMKSGLKRGVLAIKETGQGYVNPDIQSLWVIFQSGGEG